MVERFFLDGVDVPRDEFSIGMSIENTSPVFPDVADAEFSIRNQTAVAAQEAGNLIVFLLLIKHRFFKHGFSPGYLLTGEGSLRRGISSLSARVQHCGSSAKRSGFPCVKE